MRGEERSARALPAPAIAALGRALSEGVGEAGGLLAMRVAARPVEDEDRAAGMRAGAWGLGGHGLGGGRAGEAHALAKREEAAADILADGCLAEAVGEFLRSEA